MGSEELFASIPSGWEYKTLGAACAEGGGDIQTGPFGSQLHAADYVPIGIPSIMPQNIGDNRIHEEGIARITPEDARRLSRYLVRTGDIVYSRRGDVERRALVRAHEDGWLCGTGCLRVRLGDKGADTRFVSHYLGHPNVREWIVRHAHGATMPNLNTSILGACPFLEPPIHEQRAIAHILGTLDDKIELNRKQNETLEAMARALFKAWFVDFEPVRAKMENRVGAQFIAPTSADTQNPDVINHAPTTWPQHILDLFPDRLVESALGEIPEGWEVADFGDVSACFDKNRIPLSSKQRELKKGAIPYHGATSVMDFVDEAIFNGVYLLLGEDGSVLKEDGTPFIQYIWGKSWVNNHAHVLQGANGVSTEHLMLFIAAQNITAYVTGAVQLKLNQKNMNSIPFVKASNEINAAFGNSIAPLFDQFRQLSEQSRSLAQLRDTLLPKLISGAMRVPDAERILEEASS